jgi:hypothetical protein
MEKIMLIILLTFVSIGATYAQKITVKVTDNKGKPLPYTSLLLKKDSVLVKGELSDAAGVANFDKISDGRYFIQASIMSYTTANSPVFTVDANHKNIQLSTLVLQPSSKSLQGVTVSAQKALIERKNGTTILNVESSVAAAGGTALDVLKRAPGVQVDQDDNILLKGNKGATVMLDGKLTYLSGDQLANLLKSLPAESISQIEIITSPSAKYDAAGNSGIINIKTKKGTITGFNGSFTAGVGAGRYPLVNSGINLNWRTEKFNLYGSYNYRDRQFFNDRTLIRNITGDLPQTFATALFAKKEFTSNNYKAGIDYFITPKHTIGVLVNGYDNAFYNHQKSQTAISDAGKLDSVLHSYTTNNDHFNNTTVNLNYKGQLDTTGTEISMDADYAKFNYKHNIYLNDSMYRMHDIENYDPHGIRNNTMTEMTIKSIKADLVLPFNKKLKLETGVKASFVTTDNNMLYDSLRLGKYEQAASQSNRFMYEENVLAAYATLKITLKGYDIQGGLRLEQTQSKGESVTLGTNVKRKYLDFFPSFSADHTFSESHKMGVSFSRRIYRPDYDDLNPFLFFLDKYTYHRGNPYLNPEYTNTAELSYTFKQKYIATLGYSATKDIMLEFLEADSVTKITTSYDKNFDRRNGYYATLTIPIDPFKWWNITNNINVNYNSYHVKDTAITLANSIVSMNYQTTHTFTLPADWKLELNGYYNTPFIWGIFHGRANYAIGVGVQKSLYNKKVVLKLNANDIFQGDQFRATAKYTGFDMRVHNIYQSRNVNFSLTWNFGNSAVKGAREKQDSEEQRRTGN